MDKDKEEVVVVLTSTVVADCEKDELVSVDEIDGEEQTDTDDAEATQTADEEATGEGKEVVIELES